MQIREEKGERLTASFRTAIRRSEGRERSGDRKGEDWKTAQSVQIARRVKERRTRQERMDSIDLLNKDT